MSAPPFTVEQFKVLAREKFSFLEDKGFHRAPNLEESTPTVGSVVYIGKHVGFVFSLDVRDQCVDAQVVRVGDGEMKRNWESGYSSDLFAHLVRHTGYRGMFGGASAAEKDTLEGMVNAWAELLKQAGKCLLSDRPDSLPVRT